jgi:hypothetical protein
METDNYGPRVYDFHNFFKATVADWSLCEIPDDSPDFVSSSGSAYWDLGNGVRRLSDHWGAVASCKWLMEGRRVRAFICGECPYEEFRSVWRCEVWSVSSERKSTRDAGGVGSLPTS